METVWRRYFRANRKHLFDFADDDIIWKIVEKCGMNQSEIKMGIMGLAYTYIHSYDDEQDETCKALSKGFTAFEIDISPLQPEEFDSAFRLKPSFIKRLLRRLFGL